jgi:hypothetical protein
MIDFFVPVDHSTRPYAKLLRETGERLKSGHHIINWNCAMIGPGNPPDGYNCVARTAAPTRNSHRTMAHGIALNMCTSHIKSSRVIYADCDVALLHKDWDSIVMQELDTYDCFGADFAGTRRRYRRFPGLFFFCFGSHILKNVELDFTPLMKNNYQVEFIKTTERTAEFIGWRQGQMVKCDTGWRIAADVQEAGYTGHVMIGTTTSYPNHGHKWQYNGHPFLIHMGNCSQSNPDKFQQWVSVVEGMTI